jgi:hypothetical protein
MSDVEEKKSGYRLEYAKNNRAKCKGMSVLSANPVIYHHSHCFTRLTTSQDRSLVLVSRRFTPLILDNGSYITLIG